MFTELRSLLEMLPVAKVVAGQDLTLIRKNINLISRWGVQDTQISQFL
ncbi:hypothetical protein PDM28_00895 [Stenotrophomonas aracearum]|uniref:Uncharacterized protein n=1 Tax=Stenotrophomonas aracearum TaxID=3003272 RepID=A0ABY9YE07_9GAMM|nr:hypothetical protein [Stenotrophomonas sp. A5588]WNH48922.1 hypothetical protein PDM28_00895 [Stenotrophomonas sp. A5588]